MKFLSLCYIHRLSRDAREQNGGYNVCGCLWKKGEEYQGLKWTLGKISVHLFQTLTLRPFVSRHKESAQIRTI